MDPTVRFSIFCNQAKLQSHKEVGDIFSYDDDSGFVGLKMIAEIIVRLKSLGIASFLIHPDGILNMLILPSGSFRYGFHVDEKLDKFLEKDMYTLIVQHENNIKSGNYVMIRINEEGSRASIHTVYENKKDPVYLISLDLETHDNSDEIIRKLYRLVIGELQTLDSMFMPLT